MNANLGRQRLKEIKSLDLDGWSVGFWLVKRKMSRKTARYEVLRVNTDARLQQRLRGYLHAQFQQPDFHVEPYDFNNADGDDVLFAIAADATDFAKVAAAIGEGFDNPHARSYQELLDAWAYVVLFEHRDRQLFAWRKINADTQPKKVKSKSATFFQAQKLIDIEEKEIFLIDPRYDFLVFDGAVLIANKRQFEISMNFREGMQANGEEVLKELEHLAIVSDVEVIRKYVGNNLHHLRKLSAIRKSAYYRQPGYMGKLVKINQQEKWGLKIEHGRIVVEEATVELLLTLLNNDRLRSPINDELFDSAVKAPVSGGTRRP